MFANPLADFVIRLNGGLTNCSDFVSLPYTVLHMKIVRMLFKNGCLTHFSLVKIKNSSLNEVIKIKLRFVGGRPVINKITLISKPGLKVYWTVSQLAHVIGRNTFQGFYILSTSKGLVTSNELLVLKTLGSRTSGEVILKIDF